MAPGKLPRATRQQIANAAGNALVAKLQSKASGGYGRGRARTVKEGGGPSRRNDYLATLLDPENVKGVGIPDFDLTPSSKIQTSKRIRVTTDASGNFTAVIMPCMYRGIIKPGIDGTTGNYHLVGVVNGAAPMPAFPVGSTNATTDSVITDNDRAYLCANFEAIRPVSMAVKSEVIGAALTMSGDLLLARTTSEGLWFPASFSTLAPLGIESNAFTSLPNPTYVSPADVMSGKGQLESLSREAVVTYIPEGPKSYDYVTVPTNASATAVVEEGSSGCYVNKWFVAGSTSSPGNNDCLYLLPWSINSALPPGVGDAVGPTVANSAYLMTFEPNVRQPGVVVKIEGAPASTAVIELEIIVNWEALARNSVTALVPTAPTFSNPDELAQANNIVSNIPAAYYPGTPAMPANQIRTLAVQAAGHLYTPGVHRQDAITGVSLFTKLRRGVGGLLKSAAGALAAIPKAGPLLSGGAALLGSLMSR